MPTRARYHGRLVLHLLVLSKISENKDDNHYLNSMSLICHQKSTEKCIPHTPDTIFKSVPYMVHWMHLTAANISPLGLCWAHFELLGTPRSWNPANKMTSLFEPGCIGCIFLSKPYIYPVLGLGKPSPWHPGLPTPFHCLLLWYLSPVYCL